ncbi:YcnI family protein [Prosthecomicrobium hirschii]|uniref:YncI copper-binding domain-containing protein n=1 Tax=Prosthecodimorpha hirschii TaxID=665126 RepID=A0A0P6VRI2_9HYPH|nr:DUF1775 domain-containing protein [Prosthecomicrobium hirschii]KPL54426.1 hypothetical protein ABB55_21230 [Prosthecomicrobium hirschii]MCW1840733.1 DUF1775 domain-containing protein [Prosthecomicrobium hirschii]TPQ53022.1 DUF1775 domain-containing protein [Prosthecomicrobium hirschii]
MTHKSLILGALFSVAAASSALAHATLEGREAKVGSTYKAVLRVPHGCAGAPTLKVRVKIPEGFIAVKPMPKAGWTLETVKGKYAKTYDYYGTPLSEGVTEVVWTGKLLDEHYDEFVFRGSFVKDLKPDTVFYFPAVQECEAAAERWIEIPAAGQSSDDLKFPAPGVKLLPATP